MRRGVAATGVTMIERASGIDRPTWAAAQRLPPFSLTVPPWSVSVKMEVCGAIPKRLATRPASRARKAIRTQRVAPCRRVLDGGRAVASRSAKPRMPPGASSHPSAAASVACTLPAKRCGAPGVATSSALVLPAVALAAGLFCVPLPSAGTTYSHTLTGAQAADATNGYAVSTDGSRLTYSLADGDAIQTTGAAVDVRAIDLSTAGGAVVLNTAGATRVVAARGKSTATTLGGAEALVVRDREVALDGAWTLGASDTNTTAADGTVLASATGLSASGHAAVSFANAPLIGASSAGSATAVALSDQASLTLGTGASLSATNSRSTSNASSVGVQLMDQAILNALGPLKITSTGASTAAAVSGMVIGASATLRTNGTADVYAGNGLEAVGVQSDGVWVAESDTLVRAVNTAKARGIVTTANASTQWDGATTVDVRGGSEDAPAVGIDNAAQTTTGLQVGASLAVTSVNGRVDGGGDATGIRNTGRMSASADAPITVSATAETAGKSAVGVDNARDLSLNGSVAIAVTAGDGGASYGVRNTGAADFTGGVIVAARAGNPSTALAVAALPGASNSSLRLSAPEGSAVQLDGDVATASAGGVTGTVEADFDGADSWLRGNSTAAGDQVGAATLSFANGATWRPYGTGPITNDIGHGTVTFGNGSGFDTAAFWGTFAPGNVPTFATRTVTLDSSTHDGAVTLNDGATFTLVSDISGKLGTPSSDKIVFGSGISTLSALGTQRIAIAYDPVLDDPSWVNGNLVKAGGNVVAAAPLVVLDASAASRQGVIHQVSGVTGAWSGTYENALVQFAYTPLVSLNPDCTRVSLTGFHIGTGASDTAACPSTPTTPDSGTGGSDQSGDGGDLGSTGGIGATAGGAVTPEQPGSPNASDGAIHPSTGVLTAAAAAAADLNLWSRSTATRSARAAAIDWDQAESQGGFWTAVDGATQRPNMGDGSTYREQMRSASAGIDRGWDSGDGTLFAGVDGQSQRASVRYPRGQGRVRINSMGGYVAWATVNGWRGVVDASWGRLRSSYYSVDTLGRRAEGHRRLQTRTAGINWGKRLVLGPSIYLEPALIARYLRLGGSAQTMSNGVALAQAISHASEVGASAKFGYQFTDRGRPQGEVYVNASLVRLRGFDVDQIATKDGGSLEVQAPVRSTVGSTLKLGANLRMGRRSSLFAEAGREKDAYGSGLTATVGVRVAL